MKITNELNLPQPIVTAVTQQNYDPGPSDITVTSLIDSPQVRKLKSEFENHLVEDASMRVWALFGDAIHQILDDIPENKLVTNRLYLPVEIEVDGVTKVFTIGGLVDRCVLLKEENSIVLQDYKTATTWEHIFGIKPDRERQLNLYALMINTLTQYKVDRIEAVMLFKDWTANQIERNADYPKRPVQIYELPLWEQEQTLKYIEDRLLAHFYEEPTCTAEERWEKNGTFRLMPESYEAKTRALRVTNTKQEMDDYLEWCKEHRPSVLKKNPIVIETPPVQVRCSKNSIGYSYCPVSEFCPQWREIREQS